MQRERLCLIRLDDDIHREEASVKTAACSGTSCHRIGASIQHLQCQRVGRITGQTGLSNKIPLYRGRLHDSALDFCAARAKITQRSVAVNIREGRRFLYDDVPFFNGDRDGKRHSLGLRGIGRRKGDRNRNILCYIKAFIRFRETERTGDIRLAAAKCQIGDFHILCVFYRKVNYRHCNNFSRSN